MPKIPSDILIQPVVSPVPAPIIAPDARDTTPPKLKPFLRYGIDAVWNGSAQAVGECPFCGKRKFSIEVHTGQWRCFVCASGSAKGGGNIYTFINLLWERSPFPLADAAALASERRILYVESLRVWGWRKSLITGEWIIPGYSVDGKMCNLYRWTRDAKGRYTLMGPPGLNHGLLVPNGVLQGLPNVSIYEGSWDGVAFWETASRSRMTANEMDITGSIENSIIGDTDVVAIPGAHVFRDEWLPFFTDKHVTLNLDSDHPFESPEGSGRFIQPGMDGTRRIVGMLKRIAQTIYYLQWGVDGYDPELKDGWDVRDHLTVADDISTRVMSLLPDLLRRIQPAEGLAGKRVNGHSKQTNVEPIACDKWSDLVDAWREAMEWRLVMEDVIATMIAVSASTVQSGDQLFLQVIGDASSGKTRFCDAMLTSTNCFALEHLTGFHSGWKGKEGEEDYSLIGRINGKTLITPEGDVIMSSPKFIEIMSQQRRIFDGSTGATYKNSNEDKRWTGLRTPWIIAGTPALMDTDQSRLGDRFQRIILTPPTDEERKKILRRVGRTALTAVMSRSNGTAVSCLDDKLATAYGLTGGYVNHMRTNSDLLLSGLVLTEDSTDTLFDNCAGLAQLAADFRARPNYDPRKHETYDGKEEPFRLMHQNVRMATCLSIVMGKETPDEQVMRIIRKITLDTARGRTLDIARCLFSHNHRTKSTWQDAGGLPLGVLAQWMHLTEERLLHYLQFLVKINVAEFERVPQTLGYWRLSQRSASLIRPLLLGA